MRTVGLLLLTLLAACSRDAPYNYLHPVGPVAKIDDGLWRFTYAIAVVVFVLVEGALVYILIKFRHRSDLDAPKQVHGNTRMEIIWTAIPVLLLAVVAVKTVSVIIEGSKKPRDAMEITVTGHQWWWEFAYDNGVKTAGELHIPINKPIYFHIKSVDVIHSFWVPKLAGKQDAVPGRVNHLSFSAPVVGEFLGECAEFCGLSHANMRLKVFAMTRADFDQWMTNQMAPAAAPTEPMAAQGATLFANGPCIGCHTVSGTPAAGTVGPNLTHLASRTSFAGAIFTRNDQNLHKWLENPPGRKPGSKMPDLNLKESDIKALVAYLDTLK
jgi:cytochrome c oxidase subunit 2